MVFMGFWWLLVGLVGLVGIGWVCGVGAISHPPPHYTHDFSLFLGRKYTYRYPCPLSLIHVCFLLYLKSFLLYFDWVVWFLMGFRWSLAGLVGFDSVQGGCVGMHSPPPPTLPIFMILHNLGVEKVGTTPLCALLSSQLESDMFSNACNIIPIVFWLSFMILDGFSMVVGGLLGFDGV